MADDSIDLEEIPDDELEARIQASQKIQEDERVAASQLAASSSDASTAEPKPDMKPLFDFDYIESLVEKARKKGILDFQKIFEERDKEREA